LRPSADVKFDIHVLNDGRWTVFTDSATKLRAIGEAKNLLSSGKFDAAKVTEERGQKREILIWQEDAKKNDKDVTTITPVDDAPYCKKIGDFYEFDARKTIGRLLRKHLDTFPITAFELIHSDAHLRNLMRNDELFIQAVRFAANLQSRNGKAKLNDRVDFLEKNAHALSKRAAAVKLPADATKVLKKTGLAGLATFLDKELKAEEAKKQDAVRVALAKALEGTRDWVGRLDFLLDIAEMAAEEDDLSVVDGIVAEIFDGSEAVQDVLGFQRNLGQALKTLAQIIVGTFELSTGSNSTLERMTRLLKAKEMPLTRATITERLTRELSGIKKLTRTEEMVEERKAFTELVAEIFRGRATSKSGSLCEAVTLRAKSLFKGENEDESSEKAIDEMIILLPTEAAKFNYLIDLASTDFGEKYQKHVIARLAHVVDGMQTVADLVDHGADNVEVVRTAAVLRDRLLATNLPEEWRRRFAKKIYDLLMVFQTGKQPTPSKTKPKSSEKGASAQPEPLDRLTVEAGTYLFHEGDDGDNAYLVVSGEVTIIRMAGGHEVVVARAGPGSVVGEMALIDSQPRMASAKAVKETQLTIVPHQDLQARLERLGKVDPVMRKLVDMFVRRIRDFPIVDAKK